MGERPLDGAVRNSNRRADLLPWRIDGCGHRAAKGHGCRAGGRGNSKLHRGGHSGRSIGMAYRQAHHRSRRRREALRFRARGTILDCGVSNIISAPAIKPEKR